MSLRTASSRKGLVPRGTGQATILESAHVVSGPAEHSPRLLWEPLAWHGLMIESIGVPQEWEALSLRRFLSSGFGDLPIDAAGRA